VTDLAARGLDIPFLANVIHFDFPTKLKLFIHRSGRTARNGLKGTCFCLVTLEELPYMHDLSVHVGRKYSLYLGGTGAEGEKESEEVKEDNTLVVRF